MSDSTIYSYRLRPGYQSKALLLEFRIQDNEYADLKYQLNRILIHISPKLIKETDVWHQDQRWFLYDSTIGEYEISVDSWGFVFILSEENQSAILSIETLLKNDANFQKEEVNFQNYK